MTNSPQNMEKENWRERFDEKFPAFIWPQSIIREDAIDFVAQEISVAHSLGEKAMLERMHYLGMLYGEKLYIDTKNEEVLKCVMNWLAAAYPPQTDAELEAEVNKSLSTPTT